VLELFADRSRRAVVEAGDVTRALVQGFVGAERLLLGLIAEHHGVAARALDRLGVTDDNVRRELLARYPRGEHPADGMLSFTEEGKRSLESLARRDATPQ
jgi:ATP-dependent Clp protease ATP-binding subunit ClpC